MKINDNVNINNEPNKEENEKCSSCKIIGISIFVLIVGIIVGLFKYCDKITNFISCLNMLNDNNCTYSCDNNKFSILTNKVSNTSKKDEIIIGVDFGSTQS